MQENGLKMPQRRINIISHGSFCIIEFRELGDYTFFREKYWMETDVNPFDNFDTVQVMTSWMAGEDIVDLHSDLMISSKDK